MNEANKRSSPRIDPSSMVAMVHGLGSQLTPAAVIDESFFGMDLAILVRIESTDTLRVGKELVIEYANVRGCGEVRHLSALPSGCRLGIEWKPEALSTSLRALLVSKPHRNANPFALRLASGLSNMWRLLEAGQWGRLTETAERLRRESAASESADLNDAIDEFQHEVNEAIAADGCADTASPSVATALNHLILNCMDALEQNPAMAECDT